MHFIPFEWCPSEHWICSKCNHFSKFSFGVELVSKQNAAAMKEKRWREREGEREEKERVEYSKQ